MLSSWFPLWKTNLAKPRHALDGSLNFFIQSRRTTQHMDGRTNRPLRHRPFFNYLIVCPSVPLIRNMHSWDPPMQNANRTRTPADKCTTIIFLPPFDTFRKGTDARNAREKNRNSEEKSCKTASKATTRKASCRRKRKERRNFRKMSWKN